MEPTSRKCYWTAVAKLVRSCVGDEVEAANYDYDGDIDPEFLESRHNQQNVDAVDDERFGCVWSVVWIPGCPGVCVSDAWEDRKSVV